MSAEAVCAAYVVVQKPEDGETALVLCELDPLHKPPHHGHLWYDEVDESRCIDWTGGKSFVGFH